MRKKQRIGEMWLFSGPFLPSGLISNVKSMIWFAHDRPSVTLDVEVMPQPMTAIDTALLTPVISI